MGTWYQRRGFLRLLSWVGCLVALVGLVLLRCGAASLSLPWTYYTWYPDDLFIATLIVCTAVGPWAASGPKATPKSTGRGGGGRGRGGDDVAGEQGGRGRGGGGAMRAGGDYGFGEVAAVAFAVAPAAGMCEFMVGFFNAVSLSLYCGKMLVMCGASQRVFVSGMFMASLGSLLAACCNTILLLASPSQTLVAQHQSASVVRQTTSHLGYVPAIDDPTN